MARFKVLAFAISGALAAIAGLMFAVKLSGGALTIAIALTIDRAKLRTVK